MGGTSSALYDRTAEADLGEVERICTDQRAQRSKYHKYIPGLNFKDVRDVCDLEIKRFILRLALPPVTKCLSFPSLPPTPTRSIAAL